MVHWLYRLASWILPRTHEAIAYPLIGLIGSLLYWVAPRPRAQVSRNLRVVLGADAGDGAVNQETRKAFQTLVRNYYEVFHLPATSREAIKAQINLLGLEHIDAGLARGKGVLLTSLHFGNIEYLMQIPAFFPQMNFILLVEKMANAKVFEVFRNLRASTGLEMVSVDEPLKVIRCLRQNRVVGIAVDRDVTHSGIEATLFGRPAILPDGVIRLAMRTGAAIVPAYGWAEEKRRFIQIRVEPPMALVSSGNADADVRLNLERLMAIYEPVIRAHPGQWLAFHQVWKDV